MMAKSKHNNAAALSKYFLLYPDASGSEFEAVEDYDLGDFDVMTFWNGDKLEEDLPPVSIQLTEGNPTDCLGNPMSWLIVSRKCATTLTPLTGSHVQMISLPVILPNQKVAKDRYVIANPVGSIDAIYSPKKHKKKAKLVDLVINTRLVPEGIHMFRLQFHETAIVVTNIVIKAIQDSDLRGFAASPLNLFANADLPG